MIDATNRNMALASALVEELARSGVRRAVLSPGSRSSPISLALDREPGIELTVILDERVAGFVALGAALSSGRPTVVACTSGSAAANLHPAVVEADQAGVPLIVLTSDRPPELRGIGAGQTIDQIKLYGDAVRWFSEVGTHEADDTGLLHYRATACRAVAEATGGVGPVHLNLPWRDPLGPESRPEDIVATSEPALDGRPDGRPLTALIDEREPSAATVDRVAGLVEGAGRTLIVAGRSTDPGLAAAVAGLATRTGFPVLAEPTSGVRFGDHDRSGLVAAYDLILREPEERLRPDLVLRFGDMPTSKALRAWLADSGAEQVVFDPPGRWDEPTRRAGLLVRGDATALVERLVEVIPSSEELEDDERVRWRSRWLDAEQAAQETVSEILGATDELNEPAILRALSSSLPAGAQLLLASSMPVRDAEAFMPGGPAAISCYANRGANGIDGLVSTVAGLALGAGRETWAVLGDLALAHDVSGLASLEALPVDGPPVTLVVIDNGGGRIFEFLPQAEQVERGRFERLFITPSALDLERVAGAFGLDYLRIDELAELGAEPEGHALLHVTVDPALGIDLRRRIAAAVADAIGTDG